MGCRELASHNLFPNPLTTEEDADGKKVSEMEEEDSVDLEQQPQKPMDEDFVSPEVEALVEEEDPMISMQIEMNNYLQSFKIFN